MTNKTVHCLRDIHSDFIRTVVPFKQSTQNFITGSLDKTAKLFDLRTGNQETGIFEHGQPISGAAIYNADTYLVTVGGKDIATWDLRNQSEPLTRFSNNIKNITCVRVFEEENRVLTSSIDAHLKMYSLDNMELVHQMKFKAPISSFDMTSDFSHLAMGHLDGTFTISKNSSKEKKVERLG